MSLSCLCAFVTLNKRLLTYLLSNAHETTVLRYLIFTYLLRVVIGCSDVIPETEIVPADYEVFKFKQFAKRSLLTKPEVFDAMVKVKTECNKVAQMSLFHMPIMKSMRLEEFEQTQSQVSSQVWYCLRHFTAASSL